jgi:hypothetical protein
MTIVNKKRHLYNFRFLIYFYFYGSIKKFLGRLTPNQQSRKDEEKLGHPGDLRLDQECKMFQTLQEEKEFFY